MPDSELFKWVIQGGSFALMAALFVWLLFWGVPMFREDSQKSADTHKAAVVALATEHTAAVKAMLGEFRAELREQRGWISGEMQKRDAAFDRLAEVVGRVGERIAGCPHNDPGPLGLPKGDGSRPHRPL